MERLSIDAIGPLPINEDGYQYILVIIDCFTRWTELYPLKDVSAKSAADALINFAGRFGFAKQLVSDRGSQFVNSIISDVLQLLECDHSLTMAYSKEENSIVERANKEILRHLRAIVNNSKVKKDWKQVLPFVQRIINSSVNRSIGVSPAALVFGNMIDLNRNIIQDELFTSPEINYENLSDYAADLLAKQKLIISIAQEIQARNHAQHLKDQVSNPTIFDLNSWVLVSYPKNRMNLAAPTKLDTPWYGPMKVQSRQHDHYELFDPASGKFETVHVSRMKPFIYSASVNPEDIAIQNQHLQVVDKILAHRGSAKSRQRLEFHVQWNTSDPSWEPWSNLRDNLVVHEYLRSNSMSSIIPIRYRVQTEPEPNKKRKAQSQRDPLKHQKQNKTK
jgi:hypothetical protein